MRGAADAAVARASSSNARRRGRMFVFILRFDAGIRRIYTAARMQLNVTSEIGRLKSVLVHLPGREIDVMVRAFQSATRSLRYADVPVVVCPAGRTLAGGCEIALHGDRVQAAAESYIGLVETGVGLIPAGGGTKEMLARATETRGRHDLLPAIQQADIWR